MLKSADHGRLPVLRVLGLRKTRGTQVGDWTRRGKYLMATLLPERGVWGVHLRMTGQFQWHPEPSEPCRHTRVRIWNAQEQELRFVDMRSFGEMWWVPQSPWRR